MRKRNLLTSAIAALFSPFLQVRNLGQKLRHLSKDLAQLRANRSKLQNLNDENPNDALPETLLRNSPPEVRNALIAMLGKLPTITEADLVAALRNEARGLGGKVMRKEGPPYDRMLEMVCGKLGLPKKGSRCQLEQRITIKIFNQMWEKLPPEKQDEILRKMQEEQSEGTGGLAKNLASPVIAAGGIMAAQASGFGIFLAASTIVGAATQAVGIALPFAFYTGMSHAIAIAIGPVGWLAVAGLGLRSLFKDRRNYDKLGNGIALIAWMRAEQQLKWQTDFDETSARLKQIETALVKLAIMFVVVAGLVAWTIAKMLGS
jgi:hypothetical protein